MILILNNSDIIIIVLHDVVNFTQFQQTPTTLYHWNTDSKEEILDVAP